MKPAFLHCCISRLLTLTSKYIEAVTAVFTAVGPFIMLVSLNSLESHCRTDLGSPSLSLLPKLISSWKVQLTNKFKGIEYGEKNGRCSIKSFTSLINWPSKTKPKLYLSFYVSGLVYILGTVLLEAAWYKNRTCSPLGFPIFHLAKFLSPLFL